MKNRDHDLLQLQKNRQFNKTAIKSRSNPSAINGDPLAKGMQKTIVYFDVQANILSKKEFSGYHSNSLSLGIKQISETKTLQTIRNKRQKSEKNKIKDYRKKFIKSFAAFFGGLIEENNKYNNFLLPLAQVYNFAHIRKFLDNNGYSVDRLEYYSFLRYIFKKTSGMYYLTRSFIFQSASCEALPYGVSIFDYVAFFQDEKSENDFLSYLDAIEKAENRLNSLISQHKTRLENDTPMPVYAPKEYKHTKENHGVDRDILGNKTSFVVLPVSPADCYIKKFFSELPRFYILSNSAFFKIADCLPHNWIVQNLIYPSCKMDFFRKF